MPSLRRFGSLGLLVHEYTKCAGDDLQASPLSALKLPQLTKGSPLKRSRPTAMDGDNRGPELACILRVLADRVERADHAESDQNDRDQDTSTATKSKA